ECPGQTFQARKLLLYLRSSLAEDGEDILLEPYLKLHLKSEKEQHWRPDRYVYRSVRSMVEGELKAGQVNFSYRTDSGCRTLLRLHRSLLWLKMMLEGLSKGPDSEGRYKTCPFSLPRDAYKVALAPHHPWMLRQAAEIVFLALPDREYFLQLVCVKKQEEATPVLRIIIQALSVVHTRTQRILKKYDMLELP
uniref:Ceramide-1-phosphate transfer protein-like n=1 Tax=Cyprinodon variegatus TaxID=28743 RepID=A0A3Q2GE97_CYPVA